jgi:hypothetical protein
MPSKQPTERVVRIDTQSCKAIENVQWKPNAVPSLKNLINGAGVPLKSEIRGQANGIVNNRKL